MTLDDGSIPQPPVDMLAGSTAGWFFTILVGIPAAACYIWAIWWGLRRRDPLPLLCMLIGFASSFIEPIVDVLGHVWWPVDLPLELFTLYDRHIYLFVGLGYSFFPGLATWLVYRYFLTKPTKRDMLAKFIPFAVVTTLFEIPGLLAGVYVYYGDQPFEVFGYPLWWPVINNVAPLLGGGLMLLAAPLLTGWRRMALALAVPIGYGGAYGAVAWPTFAALNLPVPAWVQWSAAVITIAMCTLIGLAIVQLVARDAVVGTRQAPSPTVSHL
ncbi:MAG: hypothetical protein HYZ38_20635 [Mycobacterium sp.]|nr:hypothetical protein [Mycobacterium sp.]